MKTIGLIGGMSWESTLSYYRIINQTVNERLGGLHSARMVLYSVEFDEIHRLQNAGEWQEAGAVLVRAARALQAAGADFLVLCTNTMHKVADVIERSVDLPLLHIADATARRVSETGVQKVGLLGTRFTMRESFYRSVLRDRHGLQVIVPGPADIDVVDKAIFEELCHGRVLAPSAQRFQEIIRGLVSAGAEGVILGCTEISMLVGPADASVPVFDTMAIHATAAADLALHDSDGSPVDQ
jgi:amino-acid racemase